MSAPGHCRHCGTCAGPLHHSGKGAMWLDGDCPACDEAERIAAWADEQAQRVLSERSHYYDDRDVRAREYDRMADFARGES